LGKLGISGIFNGEHIFTLQSTNQDSTRFIHREEFRGVLIPLIMPFIARDTLRGFNDMNAALKRLVKQSE